MDIEVSGRPLLLYLASDADPQRLAVGPGLAAAAERAGFGFECYYDAPGRGRHYGGGEPPDAAFAAGAPVAGGDHAGRALRLCTRHSVLALGDPGSPLWPTLDGPADALARSTSAAELYAAALERLRLEVPELVLVLDAAPQGPAAITTAPFLYPAFFTGPSALGLEASAGAEERAALERLGARRFVGLGVAPERAAEFPGGLDEEELFDLSAGWAGFTADAARRHRSWGRGVLLGDPAVVTAHLPKARRLRLLPLHGRPQTQAVAAAGEIVGEAAEPVFGRQWDDRDFIELARAGHGLQVLDPGPPFDATAEEPLALPDPPQGEPEPDDPQLERWASEGRVLVTLLFWCGMVRELDCLPRVIDLLAATGLRAGLVLTAETFTHGSDETLRLLAVPPDRGGVFGRLEPLLGSTGYGVAAETYLGPDRLARYLRGARAALEPLVPEALRPRGWWPLLDAPLVPQRELPLGLRGRTPVVRFRPRGEPQSSPGGGSGSDPAPARRDLRALVGRSVRSSGLDALLEERRPYDGWRPGGLDDRIVAAVRQAGFDYMWSKSGFGEPHVLRRDGSFVVLPFTAGNWDGWSPFYTVGDLRSLRRAERSLLSRGGPGWLASTIDTPLFALPGEVWEHGSRLYEIAHAVARGGKSGELVNVTPHVIARYARLLTQR